LTKLEKKNSLLSNILAVLALYLACLSVWLTFVALNGRRTLLRLLEARDVTWLGRIFLDLSGVLGRAWILSWLAMTIGLGVLFLVFVSLRMRLDLGLLKAKTAWVTAVAALSSGFFLSWTIWYLGFVQPFSRIIAIIK